jgi:TorA maturation chaperone TorD
MVVTAEDSMRASTYTLLGTLLARPPSGDILSMLQAIDAPVGDGQGALTAAWDTLRLASERSTLEGVDDEYHDLFIGIGRGELVPYGSWYLVGFMMDKPLAVLRQDLATLGFERQEGVYEPEDHAAALCETMGLIINSDDVPFDTQRKFFSDHLGPWMGRFFQDLQNAKSARFYRAVGQLGEQFLEIEKQYLAMLS